MAAKKPAPKKVVAKKTVTVAKPAPKKAVAKTPAKKAVAKPLPKKAVAKAAPTKKVIVKAAPAKKVAVKAAPPKKVEVKKVATKVAPKKVVAKVAPKKAVAKAAPPKKVEVKKAEKVVAKVASKKVEVAKAVKPIKEEKQVKTKPAKTPKAPPTKTIIANNSVPKKLDVFKTNTFATSNLKNETGKVIAHRKTSELKRNSNEDSAKKFEPEFTRSILDMTGNDSKTTYRYSDEDLVEFKDLINKKLDTAKAELQYLQGVIMRKDESGTEDTENKYQNMEDGSASMDREQFNQLASRQLTFITHLEQALVRIENKTYGVCRDTGKLIDKARLRAVPHATLSIEAKNAKK